MTNPQYIVTSMVFGGKYFIQFYKDEIRLNGLLDNAKIFEHKWQANSFITNNRSRFNSQLTTEEKPQP